MWEWLWNWEMSRRQKNFEKKESLNCLGQTVKRNLDIKNVASEDSKGSEEHVTGNWRKKDSC